MSVNPVQIICSARSRLARVAAVRTIAYFLAPAATAILLAAFLPAIGTMTWEWLGYLLDPAVAETTRLALAATGAAMLLGAAVAGWRSYRNANDFAAAAARLDARLGAREQIVTLAGLAGPETPESPKEHRSSLFPLLWRNVMAALSGVDPRNLFRFEVSESLKRSSLYATAIAAALGLAMLALVEPPTQLQKTALRLEQLAGELERGATAAEDQALAKSVRKAAQDLMNPKLPPEEKLKRLRTAMRDIEKHQQQKNGSEKSKAAGGAGTAQSSANASGKGKGQGQGEGQGQGQGQRQGKGPGKGGQASSGGQGAKKKGEKNATLELRNELSKAEALVQTKEESRKKSGTKPSPEEKTGNAPVPGNRPDLQGGEKKKGNGEIPKPGETGAKKSPNSTAHGQSAKKGASIGNTHLGEFPAPAKYERFYKPGAKGAALNIQDARYVTFRIPSATPSSGGGKTVIDTGRPRATTPYTNAPLAPTRENLPPEERQLVPPRYRDLIR